MEGLSPGGARCREFRLLGPSIFLFIFKKKDRRLHTTGWLPRPPYPWACATNGLPPSASEAPHAFWLQSSVVSLQRLAHLVRQSCNGERLLKKLNAFVQHAARLIGQEHIGSGQCGSNRLPARQLLVGFVHADERELWGVGRVVDIEHLFHTHDKSGAAIGRDFPVFAQVRLKFVFFRARCTLMVETLGAIFSSTTFSASRRTVHRARPAGAGEHAKAVSRASKAPSKVIFRGLAEGLRSNAASIPSSNAPVRDGCSFPDVAPWH